MDLKKKIQYEKPRSLNAGRLSQAIGADCSDGSAAGGFACETGSAAADCTQGTNLTNVPACLPNGLAADNRCDLGQSAIPMCWSNGSTATGFCSTGSSAGTKLFKVF
ncbi:hypothetical protein JXA80_11980 [bacterium]|nr:hypothetical protein [candidate division CSSED10-310 bacterium]